MSGGGGMVQGATNAEFKRMLAEWTDRYGLCYHFSTEGYHRILEFVSERDFVLFVQTFKPKHTHWWNNAKIER